MWRTCDMDHLRDVFCSRSWPLIYSYMAGESKCLSEPSSAKCSSFPASISQSACNCHGRQCPRHTTKQVKQSLEAKNIEIIKWPGLSPDLNPIENLLKILGDKVMVKKPTTVIELWKRLGKRMDHDHTSAV